jgi:hypothetical protein
MRRGSAVNARLLFVALPHIEALAMLLALALCVRS